MNTTQERLVRLDNKIKEHEQLITLYKRFGFDVCIEQIKYHANLIKYYKKRKALVGYYS